MNKKIEGTYDHKKVEKSHYQNWVNKGYFTAGDSAKMPFCIVIPPPNVTGKLHLGHAWDTTLQDIIVRYKRLQGYDVLWMPGMDHAGIATQAKIEERLKEEGITRYEMGREAFLDRAWEWKDEYAQAIHEQWEKLGLSLDYSRERFTLDEGLSTAVNKVFIDLYKDGLIYQGERIINWDPQAKTALSNIEVEHKEIEGAMYYFRYEVVENKQMIVIATTRPETMFADQAIFVHPKDARYLHLHGMHVINPANDDVLPILVDDYIDLTFGTAIMKCTPAHDPNDFALAKKYNLKAPVCMNADGTMNDLCRSYAQMDRFACRKALVNDFEEKGVVDHIEKHMHQVGHSQRTGVIVEPFLSKQWFVKMKPLAQAVLKQQKNSEERIHFFPKRFEKTFEQWLDNIEDWCISRQLWWGHRIPAWYHVDSNEIFVGEAPIHDPEHWKQDEDVLDTWFSSALWPFSTLGWPAKCDDLARYFPNDVLVTGYDIIFFWVARMAFQSHYFMNQRPFRDVLIHGLVRDEKGQKMSKSLGNGIDPMDVIEKYGADALRFFLTTNSAPGQDLRFSNEKIEASTNFINKIWNAAKFLQMQDISNLNKINVSFDGVSVIDKWMIARYNEVLVEVSNHMDKYDYALVGNALYSFIWDDVCNWYLELSKATLNGDDEIAKKACKSTLRTIWKGILCMLHPFMPFVSEEIYISIFHDFESIQKESYPSVITQSMDQNEVFSVQQLISIIQVVRGIKTEYQVKPKDEIEVLLMDESKNIIKLDEGKQAILFKMCHAKCIKEVIDEEMVIRSIEGGSLAVKLASIIDIEDEIIQVKKELNILHLEIERAQNMLENENFTSKAPLIKVQAEKDKLARFLLKEKTSKQHLSQLQKKQ